MYICLRKYTCDCCLPATSLYMLLLWLIYRACLTYLILYWFIAQINLVDFTCVIILCDADTQSYKYIHILRFYYYHKITIVEKLRIENSGINVVSGEFERLAIIGGYEDFYPHDVCDVFPQWHPIYIGLLACESLWVDMSPSM